MANNKYISSINLGGSSYVIKDTEARASISDITGAIQGGTHFIGTTKTEITDKSSIATLVPYSENSLAKTTGFASGDIVIYKKENDDTFIPREFIWNSTSWSELGSTGSLGSLAYKSLAKGDITIPSTNHIHTVNAHSHSIPTLNATVSASYTPSGSVKVKKGESSLTVGKGTTLMTSDDFETASVITEVGAFSPATWDNVDVITSANTFTASVDEGTEVLKLISTPGGTASVSKVSSGGSFGGSTSNSIYVRSVNIGTTTDLTADFKGSSTTITAEGTASTANNTGNSSPTTGGPSSTTTTTITVE